MEPRGRRRACRGDACLGHLNSLSCRSTCLRYRESGGSGEQTRQRALGQAQLRSSRRSRSALVPLAVVSKTGSAKFAQYSAPCGGECRYSCQSYNQHRKLWTNLDGGVGGAWRYSQVGLPMSYDQHTHYKIIPDRSDKPGVAHHISSFDVDKFHKQLRLYVWDNYHC